MIIYFTGTGNSRFAAELLARQLHDTCCDAGQQIREGKHGIYHSDTPWVFVCPTYAWRLPRVFEAYLRQAELSGSQEAYFVLTCGSEIGNAGKYAIRLCRDKGLQYRGILQVVMPENYIAMFDAPEQEQAMQIIAQSRPVLLQGAQWIRQHKPFPMHKAGMTDRLKSGVVNRVFYPLFVKADAFYATDACVGCGKCVKACVLNNVSLQEGRPIWGRNCTHCMACICGCPVEAIEYGKKSQGKPRYQCPEVLRK